MCDIDWFEQEAKVSMCQVGQVGRITHCLIRQCGIMCDRLSSVSWLIISFIDMAKNKDNNNKKKIDWKKVSKHVVLKKKRIKTSYKAYQSSYKLHTTWKWEKLASSVAITR